MRPTFLQAGAYRLNVYKRTHVMGIVNVTPDSFYDGGYYEKVEDAVVHGEFLAREGADILDIGGESTRPGSRSVSAHEEIDRVIPVIEKLKKVVDVPISIDTTKAKVAKAALDAGAVIINDISGLQFDPEMGEVAANCQLPVIIMHIKGTPDTMQDNPVYKNVVDEVHLYFEERIKKAHAYGISRANILIDPGIGFGKRLTDDCTLIKNISAFNDLGCPIVIGPSRKSFIEKILHIPVEERLEGTAAAITAAIMAGAHIIRVHDVREMVRVARITDAIRNPEIL